MDKIIVEVGSTCTKVDKFNGKNVEKLEGKTIQFKKHYNEDKKLRESDVNALIESINNKIGVIDVMQKFPDLAENFATTNLETVKEFIKERLNLPKEKADILILAGGGHEKFARYSGITYEKNTLYKDEASPIMMDIETRKNETERYYKSISLDEIIAKSNDPDWWYATRAMCAFVLVVAEEIGAKYIVPTDISMVYGILDKEEI